eukprot:gnl/TRDRNA2_/TRDRNA2_169721_c4_seq1.p1 gnl/TRDRNA2_/TRDRNA2_169721_c4~~gnl/TRDRNA2_/TRDRNA2_169721_c4_seq1.p1  ORF type:complete len:466 (+),score=70.44 gnl/TRDRNA2_/TRDRNA2_169721_c4_seq1:63-1400(+)
MYQEAIDSKPEKEMVKGAVSHGSQHAALSFLEKWKKRQAQADPDSHPQHADHRLAASYDHHFALPLRGSGRDAAESRSPDRACKGRARRCTGLRPASPPIQHAARAAGAWPRLPSPNAANAHRASPESVSATINPHAAASALLTACAEGDVPLIEAVAHRHDAFALLRSLEDGTRRSPLHIAACRGHAEAVKFLVEFSAELNSPDGRGSTPLGLACMNGHRKVVQLLLTSDADVRRCDHLGRNAFHLSCCSSDPSVPRMLLQRRQALISTVDGQGRTALSYAVLNVHARQRPAIMMVLLEARAEVNEADAYGRTPLWYASDAGSTRMVALLLKHRADPSVQDIDGRTPIAVADGKEVTSSHLRVAQEQRFADDEIVSEADMASREEVDFREAEEARSRSAIRSLSVELARTRAAVADRDVRIAALEARARKAEAQLEMMAPPSTG